MNQAQLCLRLSNAPWSHSSSSVAAASCLKAGYIMSRGLVHGQAQQILRPAGMARSVVLFCPKAPWWSRWHSIPTSTVFLILELQLTTSFQLLLKCTYACLHTWVRSTIVDPRYWDFTRNETTAEMRLPHQTVQILIWDAWRCGPDTPMLKDFRSESSIREWSIAVWLCNTGWWCNNHLEKWWSSSMVGGIIPYMENKIPVWNHQPDKSLSIPRKSL